MPGIAGLTYLAWGLWHGVLLSAEKIWKRKPGLAGWGILSGVVVFHWVAAGWVLFRSDSLPAAVRFFAGMAAGGQWFLLAECLLPVAAAGVAIGLADAPGLGFLPPAVLSSKTLRSIVSVAAVFAIAAIWLLGWATGGGGQPFIYGSF